MAHVYVGSTYYFDGEHFRDPSVCAIHEDLDKVSFYMQNIRGLVTLDTRDPDPAAMNEIMNYSIQTNTIGVCGEIVKWEFADQTQLAMFLSEAHRDQFYLVLHNGDVDTKLAHSVRKKDNEHGVFVPEIVERIIWNEQETLKAELTITMNSLKKIYLYTARGSDLKRINDDVVQCIRVLDGLKHESPDITEQIISRHPIFFCSEPEYRTYIRAQLSAHDLQSQYKQKLYED